MNEPGAGNISQRADGQWAARVSWNGKQVYLVSSRQRAVVEAKLAEWLKHPSEPLRTQRQRPSVPRPALQARFLAALVKLEGNHLRAAELVGINRETAYKWIHGDPAFAAQYEEAKALVRPVACATPAPSLLSGRCRNYDHGACKGGAGSKGSGQSCGCQCHTPQ